MPGTDRTGLEGYEALVSELQATAPSAPERLRERVLELAPGARARMPRRRRLVLVVVPVAVVFAVGAALVHGFVSSGSRRSADLAAFAAASPHTFAHAQKKPAVPRLLGPGKTTDSTPADKVLSGTSYSAEQAFGGTATTPVLGAPPAPNSVVIPKNRLVHADATLQVRVPSHAALTRATNRATQIVGSLGGYAQNVQYQASRKGYGNAFLALRVPVGKAEQAIMKLSSLGTLLSQQVSTQDLQQQLTHENNGIGSLRRAIAVYEQALSGSLSASQRVDIEIKLENARHAITQLRKNRSGTLASGATADISLNLTTQNGAVVGGHHKRGRFDRLLGSAGDFLALEGIIVLYALVVASPFVVLGALGWWLVRERRRRDERLLASV